MNRKQAVAAAQLAFPTREVSARAVYGGPRNAWAFPRCILYARTSFAGGQSFSVPIGEGLSWDQAVLDMQHRPHRFPMAKPAGDA